MDFLNVAIVIITIMLMIYHINIVLSAIAYVIMYAMCVVAIVVSIKWLIRVGYRVCKYCIALHDNMSRRYENGCKLLVERQEYLRRPLCKDGLKCKRAGVGCEHLHEKSDVICPDNNTCDGARKGCAYIHTADRKPHVEEGKKYIYPICSHGKMCELNKTGECSENHEYIDVLCPNESKCHQQTDCCLYYHSDEERKRRMPFAQLSGAYVFDSANGIYGYIKVWQSCRDLALCESKNCKKIHGRNNIVCKYGYYCKNPDRCPYWHPKQYQLTIEYYVLYACHIIRKWFHKPQVVEMPAPPEQPKYKIHRINQKFRVINESENDNSDHKRQTGNTAQVEEITEAEVDNVARVEEIAKPDTNKSATESLNNLCSDDDPWVEDSWIEEVDD